jgi:hypothetical protein
MRAISLLFAALCTFVQSSVYSEGDIGDAKCSVESVEFAVTGAFKEILSGSIISHSSSFSHLELVNCTYLRLFRVNMNKQCEFWTKPSACEDTCGLTPPLEAPPDDTHVDECESTCSLGVLMNFEKRRDGLLLLIRDCSNFLGLFLRQRDTSFSLVSCSRFFFFFVFYFFVLTACPGI